MYKMKPCKEIAYVMCLLSCLVGFVRNSHASLQVHSRHQLLTYFVRIVSEFSLFLHVLTRVSLPLRTHIFNE